eukprot:1162035-Pelagomonas_calceolata.AAC.4
MGFTVGIVGSCRHQSSRHHSQQIRYAKDAKLLDVCNDCPGVKTTVQANKHARVALSLIAV